MNSASGTPIPEVGRILGDPSFSQVDKLTRTSMMMMADLDRDIDETARRIAEIPPGPSHDVEPGPSLGSAPDEQLR